MRGTIVSGELSRRQPVPLYYQLEMLLRKSIEVGTFDVGTPLPGEKELARTHGISRVTVRQALQRLEDDGLIVRQRGKGTFVAPDFKPENRIERNIGDVRGFEEDLLRLGLEPHAEVLGVETIVADQFFADLMCVDVGELLVRVRRRGYSGSTPLWLESRTFPLDIGEALVESNELSAAAMMPVVERSSGHKITDIEVSIEAATAAESQAKLLSIPKDSPMHRYEKRVLGGGSRVLLYMRAAFPARYFKFTFKYRSNPTIALEARVDDYRQQERPIGQTDF